MNPYFGTLVYGLLVGCLTVGLGGLLIGSSPVPGVVFTSIALIGFLIFELVRKDYE